MKVLYIHQHFSCINGAGGTRSYEFAKKLKAYGHEPIIVCGSNAVAKTGVEKQTKQTKNSKVFAGIVDGIYVIEINIPYSNYDSFFTRIKKFLFFAKEATKICLTMDYDVLMATSTPLTVGIPCIFVKLFKHKPIVFEVRDLWPDLPIAMGIIRNRVFIWLLRFFEKVCYRIADHCIALAPGIEYAIVDAGIKSENISFLPNGCDFYLSCGDNNGGVGFRGKYFNPDDFIVIFTGAHGVANGLDSVLAVAKYLLDIRVDNIKFLFIGDGKVKPLLQDEAKKYKLYNCVFLDPIPKTVLFRDVLPSCDLGLMILKNIPAFYNGTSPNKFFDYISIGLPVLINYPGWLANLIKEYNCGYTVAPDNIQQFANALIEARDHRDELKIKGEKALKLAKDQFNREDIAEKFVKVLERVYKENSSRK